MLDTPLQSRRVQHIQRVKPPVPVFPTPVEKLGKFHTWTRTRQSPIPVLVRYTSQISRDSLFLEGSIVDTRVMPQS